MMTNVARLTDLANGSETVLAARSVVGRAPMCHLKIVTPAVSGLHAELSWDGSSWFVQDLGSRNGTFVDGQRLRPGQRFVLEPGNVLGFGKLHTRYRFADGSAPQLMAISESGECRLVEDGVLQMSFDDDDPIMVYQSRDLQWVAESKHGLRTIEDQTKLFAGGRSWCVCLPNVIAETRNAQCHERTATLDDTCLRFFVSRDGEHVSVRADVDDRTLELDARAHMHLLLCLARERIDDSQQADMGESEHGWRYRDALLDMLKIDSPLLNLWILRARRQIAVAGIAAAGTIIERRVGTHQLRIGVANLFIENA